MNATNLLLLLLILIWLVVHRLYPDFDSLATGILAIYSVGATFHWLQIWNDQRKRDLIEREQVLADKGLMREYSAELAAIRKKYDPLDEWNEGSPLPPSYRQEVAELSDRYPGLLERRYKD
jgi:hypothetical protein